MFQPPPIQEQIYAGSQRNPMNSVWSLWFKKLADKFDSLTTNSTPAGTIVYHAANTAPAGYLKANGAAVSRVTYNSLFTAIGTTWGAGDGTTTFNLPDLRGYFPRGWDDSRGIDTGRTFASTQADANLSHNHTGTTDDPGNHNHTISAISGSEANSGGSAAQSYPGVTGDSGAHTHTLTIATSGGTEARPKNISLLACIKY